MKDFGAVQLMKAFSLSHYFLRLGQKCFLLKASVHRFSDSLIVHLLFSVSANIYTNLHAFLVTVIFYLFANPDCISVTPLNLPIQHTKT